MKRRTGYNLCVCANVKLDTNGTEGVRIFTNNNKTKYSGQNVNNDWRGSGFCVMETIFKIIIRRIIFSFTPPNSHSTWYTVMNYWNKIRLSVYRCVTAASADHRKFRRRNIDICARFTVSSHTTMIGLLKNDLLAPSWDASLPLLRSLKQ